MAQRMCRLCPTNEFLIKLLFIIHFFLLNCHWIATHHLNPLQFYNNTFLLLTILFALFTRYNKSHLLHLAALIEFTCILLDCYVLNHKYIDEWKTHKLLPFNINLCVRAIGFFLLYGVASNYNSTESNRIRMEQSNRYWEMKNNNNPCDDYIEDSVEGTQSRKLIRDKVTEV